MSEDRFDTAARVVTRAVFGGLGEAVLHDQKGWDPIVPADMHTSKLPPVAEDGTAQCTRCLTRMPFAQLDIANESYCCKPCGFKAAQVHAMMTAPSDLENHKIGRSWTGTLIGLSVVAAALGIVILLYFIPPG
ncbi:MAG: hypothetical protein H0T42_15215 [Deltaproteobacteria bacterium]|nr:hypothetical protein [Deltaproteobacteria bacterium]